LLLPVAPENAIWIIISVNHGLMKLKFQQEIEPNEWLYIGAFIVIIVLLWKGHSDEAVQAVTQWLKGIPKK